ncbi:MAG: hypothetical protein HC872_00510 [Gammaproteobacteria bacterium]|nr:hypothetical protein [Gammaproteobacteria bacterium]
MAQTDRYETCSQLAQQLGETLIAWARDHDPEELLRITHPRRAGTMCVTARALGLEAQAGVIAVGFAGNDSPTRSITWS